jgi:hypothetical protein
MLTPSIRITHCITPTLTFFSNTYFFVVGAPNAPTEQRHTSIVVPPSAPQIKKLKAGERAVRRIVPVVTATDPGGGTAAFSNPGSRPSGRGAKRFVFHQSVATTRGNSVVVQRADGQKMSPSDERMNEALKR